jgi:hypothetical protein
MKAHATRGGGQAIGGHAPKIEHKDFVEPILFREARTNPAAETALLLYRQAVAAIDRLTRDATENGSSGFALANMAPICVEKALQIALASEPGAGSDHSVVEAVAVSVEKLSEAVNAQPGRFVEAAHARLTWPVLWTVKDNAKDHAALAEKLQLGGCWPIKSQGAISLASTPNAVIMLALWNLTVRERMIQSSLRYVLKAAPKPLVSMEFTPLTKDPASLDFWWNNSVKPFIESNRASLVTSGALTSYLDQADALKQKSCADKKRKDDPYRAKADTLAWNRFLTDCKKALKTLAPAVTEKTRKKP